MLNDSFSICASVIGAIAMLKGKKPTRIMVRDDLGESKLMNVAYSTVDGVGCCSCNGFTAYALPDEKDFSLHFEHNCRELIFKNPNLIKVIMSSVALVMKGIPGAALYINED